MKKNINLLDLPKALIPDFFSWRTLLITLIYSVLVGLSISIAFLLRFDFKLESIIPFDPLSVLYVALPLKLLLLAVFGQFRGLLSFFHLPDLLRIFFAMLLSAAVLWAFNVLHFEFTVPKGVIAVDFIISLVLFGMLRMGMRVLREIGYRGSAAEMHVQKRVAIIGAGDIGTSIASNLISHRNLGLKPALFLDDDREKQGKQIVGLNVFAIPRDFRELKNVGKVDRVIIASKNMLPSRIAEIAKAAQLAGVEVSIVPSTADLVGGSVKVSQIREVEIGDILGRESVELDGEVIDAMLKDKVVLVTGAGGSIGSELCMQIAARRAARLIILDQSEVQLYAIEQKLLEGEFGTPIKPVVGDVSDRRRIASIMGHFKPDIVFHAAAHKHVPMMENQPSEALVNNSHGTWILAEEASRADVEKFVLISTDKAINPTNVMGSSKRLAEMFTLGMQNRKGNKTLFSAVRFGNVLGSSGSVIPAFKAQIAKGGPVTVTHPDVTRYFMTIPEAVGLVLQCATQTSGGEIFVLDMGHPVKVMDLARQLITLSGFRPDIDIEIKITGLRPGEKLFEELQHKSESLIETRHPRIFGFVSERPKYEDMAKIADEICEYANVKSVDEMKRFIKSKVPEYTPQFYD